MNTITIDKSEKLERSTERNGKYVCIVIISIQHKNNDNSVRIIIVGIIERNKNKESESEECFEHNRNREIWCKRRSCWLLGDVGCWVAGKLTSSGSWIFYDVMTRLDERLNPKWLYWATLITSGFFKLNDTYSDVIGKIFNK